MDLDDLDAESSAERDEVPAAVVAAAAAAAAPAIPSLAEENKDPRNKFLLELFLFSVVSEREGKTAGKCKTTSWRMLKLTPLHKLSSPTHLIESIHFVSVRDRNLDEA